MAAPRKKPRGPSATQMARAASAKPRYRTASGAANDDSCRAFLGQAAAAAGGRAGACCRPCVCSRVLTTSKGVVRSEANPPARPPQARSDPMPRGSAECWTFRSLAFKNSFAATVMLPFGMFMASVTGSDLYSPAAPSAATTLRKASTTPEWCPSCKRCLITSAGVMITSCPTAATAPARPLARTSSPTSRAPRPRDADCITDRVDSKRPKYTAWAGMHASVTAPTPRQSRRPELPEYVSVMSCLAARKQSTSGRLVPQAPSHWALVLMVSRGNMQQCSARPDIEPARQWWAKETPLSGSHSSR
mmetsp:Transcript_32357/g.109020  ORF Transcript_32357/g.109020 Transcript_32357/m.109020 type:complete len:304 (+) Transcript_32357:189-1100(+)